MQRDLITADSRLLRNRHSCSSLRFDITNRDGNNIIENAQTRSFGDRDDFLSFVIALADCNHVGRQRWFSHFVNFKRYVIANVAFCHAENIVRNLRRDSFNFAIKQPPKIIHKFNCIQHCGGTCGHFRYIHPTAATLAYISV